MSRKNIQLCYPFEEARFNKWQDKAISQPKLDGFRCRALIKPDSVELLSSTEGSFRVAVPHLFDILYDYRKAFLDQGIFELDGELYDHYLPFEKISSICSRSVNTHPEHKLIQFHIFDHVCEVTPFIERAATVSNYLHWLEHDLLQPVSNIYTPSISDVESTLFHLTRRGYEGIIVRNFLYPYERKRSTGIMKWKPTKKDQYRIVDCEEELSKDGNPKNRLGSFKVEDDYGNRFSVGTGFTDYQRDSYWEMKDLCIGRSCVIKYQHISQDGIPRFPVFDVFVQ